MQSEAQPKIWPTVRFGDVVRNVDDSVHNPQESGLERFVGLEHIDPESLHIQRWGLIAGGTSFNRLFRKGQVLFGKRRAYQRKVAVAEFDGLCSSDILVFEPKDGRLLAELLPFICQTEGFYEHALDTSAGSLSPRTKFKELARYEFHLPPINEQRQISEILWATDEVIEKWEKTLEKNQICRKNYIDAFFQSFYVPDTQSNWSIESLEKLAALQTGVAKGKSYDSDDVVVFPYLSVANVQDGSLDLENVKEISLPIKEANKYLLQYGDVIITEGGDFDKVGRGTLWRSEIDPCLHQNHIFCIRVNLSKIQPEFLTIQLSSLYGKNYFLRCAKKTSNLASINSTQVKAFPVKTCSIDLQLSFTNKVKMFDDTITFVIGQIHKTIALKKSIFTDFIKIIPEAGQ